MVNERKSIEERIKNRMEQLVNIDIDRRTEYDYWELISLFHILYDDEVSEYLPYLFDYLIIDEHDEVEGISETLTNMVEDCPVEALLPCTLNNLYRYDINPGAFQGIFCAIFKTPKNIEFIKKYLKENLNNVDKETFLKLLEDIVVSDMDAEANGEPFLHASDRSFIIRDLRKILTSGDNK